MTAAVKAFGRMVVTTDGELAKPPISRELMTQAVQREMHRKVLLRAAELVAMGWTRGVSARNEFGEQVVGTSPQAASWCLNGAINRALLDVLGLNWYECRFEMGLWMTLRRPIRAVLRERSLSTSLALWNDLDCPNPQAAENVLRAAAARLSIDVTEKTMGASRSRRTPTREPIRRAVPVERGSEPRAGAGRCKPSRQGRP